MDQGPTDHRYRCAGRVLTRLLASVTNSTEAELAIRGGADLIDLKDPARGALGALPLDQILAVRSAVAGRCPVSATIGDLPPDPALTGELIRATAATGVDYVKVGLFSPQHIAACLPAITALTPRCAIVAVLFADRAPDLRDLTAFVAAGCAGVMLDTADKSGGRLLDHLELRHLSAFVAQTRKLGLLCGLAGSLRLAEIPTLMPLAPDYLGFRGALCREGRRDQILDPDRLRSVCQAVHAGQVAPLLLVLGDHSIAMGTAADTAD